MRYFGRVYRLEIGVDSEILSLNGFPDERTPAPAQIEFTVNVTPNAHRSYAEISVYGLKRRTRDSVYRQGDTVRLVAGWRDSYGAIFEGQIQNTQIGRDGAETITTLYCESASVEWTSQLNRSFGANTPQTEIMEAAAESLGFPVEFVGDFSDLPRALKGKTVARDAKMLLTEMARDFGFNWYIADNRIEIIRDGAERPGRVRTYSATTGLVGSPEITQQGVNATVLLDPFARPATPFEIEAETGDLTFNQVFYSRDRRFPDQLGKGRHRTISVTHDGSFYGDAWTTQLEGISPGAGRVTDGG